MSSTDDLNPEDFAGAAAAAIADAQGSAQPAAVLAEAGLFTVSVPATAGGMDLPLDFSVPVVRVAGQLQLAFPLVEQILLARAFAGTDHGAALQDGSSIGTIAWQGSMERGDAAHAAFAAQARVMLVADGSGAALIDIGSVRLELDDTLDPDHPQGEADLTGARVIARLDAAAWEGLQRDARILLAALAIGAAQGVLDRTTAHIGTRVQFGKPLSAKQAVRHQAAQMKVQTEVAAATLRRALLPDETGAARDTASALIGAVDNALFVVEKSIQLHGGIGFTWELPLHRSLRDIRRIQAALQISQARQAFGRAIIDAA